MSIPEKEDLLKGARSELSNFQITVKLLQALIDNFKGLSPGGAGPLWGNMFFVDNELGDDASAVPNSLTRTYQTPHNAVVAARASLLDDAALATVLFLPGTFDMGEGGITWPNVGGLYLDSLDRANTILTNDGTTPVITGVNFADGFTGGISNLTIRGTVLLDRTGAGSDDGGFVIENVGLSSQIDLYSFNDLKINGLTNTDGDPTNPYVLLHNCRNVLFDGVTIGTCRVTRDDGGICNIGLRRSAFTSSFTIGIDIATVFVEARLTMDRASTIAQFSGKFGGDTFSVSASGNLGDCAIGMRGAAGQTVDISGSAWKSLGVSGDGAAGTFNVLAIGCSTMGAPTVVTADDNVVLDVRGCSSPMDLVATGGAKIDRDMWSASAKLVVEDPPVSGLYPCTFLVNGALVPFPDYVSSGSGVNGYTTTAQLNLGGPPSVPVSGTAGDNTQTTLAVIAGFGALSVDVVVRRNQNSST